MHLFGSSPANLLSEGKGDGRGTGYGHMSVTAPAHSHPHSAQKRSCTSHPSLHLPPPLLYLGPAHSILVGREYARLPVTVLMAPLCSLAGQFREDWAVKKWKGLFPNHCAFFGYNCTIFVSGKSENWMKMYSVWYLEEFWINIFFSIITFCMYCIDVGLLHTWKSHTPAICSLWNRLDIWVKAYDQHRVRDNVIETVFFYALCSLDWGNLAIDIYEHGIRFIFRLLKR